MMLTRFLFCLIAARNVVAFLPQNQHSSSVVLAPPTKAFSTTLSAVLSYDDIITRVDYYEVAIPKPLGVIFGENPDPYFGLKIDDVSEGLNGGMAGLRIGDQLMAVNENVVVGKDFDDVMGLLQDEPTTLRLVMYRGPVAQLFTILSNQLEEGESIYEEEEEWNPDENYESPVRIEVKEEEPLTPGDFIKAAGKLASMFGEALAADPNEGSDDAAAAPPPPPQKTGFFGIGSESVQLDGNDARGYRQEKIKPDEF